MGGKYFGDRIKKFDSMWWIKERKDLKRMPWATDFSSWLDGWQYHSLIREHRRRKIIGKEGYGVSLRLAAF